MKTIIQANSTITSILGLQKIKENTFYRKYRFCFCFENEGVYLAYHMSTRELIELTYEEFSLLTVEKVCYNEEISELLKKWFFVPVENDDMKTNEQIVNILRMFDSKKFVNQYTILPTTDCNARCFYCYEANIKKKFMSEQTAIDVADYIEKNAKGEKIEIRWFGGEPLYNVQAIDTITNNLSKKGLKYKSTMVSNGYLFDDEMVIRAKNNWLLESIQITLDGTENIYNRCKNYIYNDSISPFKKVIENIKKLINNEIFVAIRLNMDNHNKDDLYELVDFLNDYLGDNKYYSIYVHMLYENSGNLQIDYSNTKHIELATDYIKLKEYLYSKNHIPRGKLSSKPSYITCMANNDHAIVIMPDGKLTKCEHALEEDIIGSIYSEEIDKKIVDSWREYKPIIERCKTCEVYPDCRPLLKCETQKYCYETDQVCKIKEYKKKIWRKYLDNKT